MIIYFCLCICLYVFVYVCVYMSVCTRVYVLTFVTRVCMCIYVRLNTLVCVSVHPYICAWCRFCSNFLVCVWRAYACALECLSVCPWRELHNHTCVVMFRFMLFVCMFIFYVSMCDVYRFVYMHTCVHAHVHVYVRICVLVCGVPVYLGMHVSVWSPVGIIVCAWLTVYVYILESVHVSFCTYKNLWNYACLCVYMIFYLFVCVCVYVLLYTCAYTSTCARVCM